MATFKRVLSIQSHVVSGYVGNKAATFPLQLLGFDVDPLNTVHFSNHSGFPTFKGERLQGEQLWELFTGLAENNLTDYSHILTGYIGSPSFLETTAKIISQLKQLNPSLTYVCDPVMGDHGKFYVSPELVPLFRDKLIPLADIAVPNQFEAEQLTGVKIENIEDAKKAANKLHDMNVKRVILTSTSLNHLQQVITLVGSQRHENGTLTQFKMEIPELPQSFTGTGDLFSALILARIDEFEENLPAACEKAIGSMQGVLERTLRASQEEQDRLVREGQPLDKKTIRKCSELRLIQSKRDLEEPLVKIKASFI